ncbi:katanin p80 WD40 repeat-containing subunit B1 isoform X1 [Carex littledalei]|uniref:Katanin p80 WD40 repeat-containing subunit B1 isoform X1 n=1 Tax=Carex littledalei TaxID=544730 RepID=A0A833QLB8_9POAL|nr:katanin p80 WD40 repeat-containing subunit B1 isoform X1 [Carex littledalei]
MWILSPGENKRELASDEEFSILAVIKQFSGSGYEGSDVSLREGLSWEPIRCHDMVDVGWSKLCDLHVHDGKLLGCSYNQTCVGIWVVDLSKVETYAARNAEQKSNISNDPPLQTESNLKSNFTRLSISKEGTGMRRQGHKGDTPKFFATGKSRSQGLTLAEKELSRDWTLMRSGTPSVPTSTEWLNYIFPSGARIGIDPHPLHSKLTQDQHFLDLQTTLARESFKVKVK